MTGSSLNRPGPNDPPEDYDMESTSVLLVLMNIINTFTQICIGAVLLGVFFFANFATYSFSLRVHIYLCVTGYVALMSQAILGLSPYTGWASAFKHQHKRGIHWVIQIIGSALVITGSIQRIVDVNNHFATTHGTLAVVALLFVFLSLIGGIINLFSTKLNISANLMKFCHALLGIVTVVLGYLALVFGLNKGLYRNTFGETNTDLMIGLTVVALVGTILSACFGMVKRICN